MSDSLNDRLDAMILDAAQRRRETPIEASSHPLWRAVRATGTRLWLDTGDLAEAGRLWRAEFSGLTTNNTLLNREVQKGEYDDLVRALAPELKALPDEEAVIEAAFVLNAVHGLRLAERFRCKVSVELHTAVSDDVERTVAYARRYHAVAPEAFFVKVPFTAAGLIATRRLSEAQIPVNLTLGFSARQNYAAAALARPRFVNVFLGRLNAFVKESGLGDGRAVGERVTLASQRAVADANAATAATTLQIAASMRSGDQVSALAGVDVFTLPPKVAEEFLAMDPPPDALRSQRDVLPEVHWAPGAAESLDLAVLDETPQAFRSAVLVLARKDFSVLTPESVREYFAERRFGGFLADWSEADRHQARAEGKIPRLSAWRARLETREITLDALMNLAGRMAFESDQAEMDRRIAGLLR